MASTLPVLLHIPHASRAIPDDQLPTFLLKRDELDRELTVMTDAFTDELFDLGAATERLVFPVSRLVLDPERFLDNAREPMASRGMGAVYTRTHDGRPLRNSLDRKALIERFYRPHHEALTDWTARALSDHGRCLILD